ncbi:MAG TPA: hypothetical protein VIV60_00230 [Polyangiaceae bacterium]
MRASLTSVESTSHTGYGHHGKVRVASGALTGAFKGLRLWTLEVQTR